MLWFLVVTSSSDSLNNAVIRISANFASALCCNLE